MILFDIILSLICCNSCLGLNRHQTSTEIRIQSSVELLQCFNCPTEVRISPLYSSLMTSEEKEADRKYWRVIHRYILSDFVSFHLKIHPVSNQLHTSYSKNNRRGNGDYIKRTVSHSTYKLGNIIKQML